MLLHPGNVGVAEHGDAVRLEVERAPRGLRHPLLGLQRQAVDEVEVERADAERTRGFGAGLRLLVGLHAADGALHRRLEVLHAEADAGHTHRTKRVPAVVGKRGRVELDGDLRVVLKAKRALSRSMTATRQSPGEGRRRAAAPVHVRDRGPTADQVRYHVDLAQEHVRVMAVRGTPAARPRCCSRSRGKAGRKTARAGRSTAAFRPAGPRASARRRSRPRPA